MTVDIMVYIRVCFQIMIWIGTCVVVFVLQSYLFRCQLNNIIIMQGVLQAYQEMPVVTRAYTTACVITTLAVVSVLFD